MLGFLSKVFLTSTMGNFAKDFWNSEYPNGPYLRSAECGMESSSSILSDIFEGNSSNYPILDTRISVCSSVRHAQTTSPGFWNGVDWRALVKSCPPNIGEVPSCYYFSCCCYSFVTLRLPPLDSETGWTGELWSNPVLLILEKYRPATTSPAPATPVSRSDYPPWILKWAGLESSGWIPSS